MSLDIVSLSFLGKLKIYVFGSTEERCRDVSI